MTFQLNTDLASFLSSITLFSISLVWIKIKFFAFIFSAINQACFAELWQNFSKSVSPHQLIL